MGKQELLEVLINEFESLGAKENQVRLLKGLARSNSLDKGFTYSGLAELFNLKDPAVEPNTKQAIKRSIRYFNKALDEFRLKLEKRLIDKGIGQILTFETQDTGGGSGNNAVFSLSPVDISEGRQAVLESAQVKGDVQYELTDIINLPMWAKPFKRVKLNGWRKFLYILAPLIVGLGSIIGTIWFLREGELLSLLAMYSTIFIIYLPFKPFYDVLENGVIKAPAWLLPLKEVNALLIKNSGGDYKELILTQYKSVCPICSGSVDVVKGRDNYEGRLIGQCERSGIEHIYSFDHITKIGFHLREPGYRKLLKNELD